MKLFTKIEFPLLGLVFLFVLVSTASRPHIGRTTISSVAVVTPPNIDGSVGYGEWPMSNRIEFDHGFIALANDALRLYILIDVLQDNVNDSSGDYFLLTFDVDRDSTITEGVDLNYGLQPETGNLRYQYYLGPSRWTRLQPNARSSRAQGFGCFIDDGSRGGTNFFEDPVGSRCSVHRVWEVAIDLAEISAQAPGNIRMGLRVASVNPSFVEDFPARFGADFTDLIEVSLASPVISIPAADPKASIRLWGPEVTQAIQNVYSTYPLVEDKTTVVRVQVDILDVATSEPVQVLLYGSKGEVDLPGSPLVQLFMAPTPVPIGREQLENTANFLLPYTWDDETIELQTKVRQLFPPFTMVTGVTLSLTFSPRESPLFWVVPINIGTLAAPDFPSDAKIRRQISFMETIFPLAWVRWQQQPSWLISPTPASTPAQADQIKTKLNELYFWYLNSWITGLFRTGEPPFTMPDQIIGSYRGSGSGSSDPTWAGGWGIASRVEDGSDPAMAHEVVHNLDISRDGTWGRHAPGCGAPGVDPDWPYGSAFNIQDVGFDTRQPWGPNTVIPRTTADLMSGCGPKWISPYRWFRLFDRFPEPAVARAKAPGSSTSMIKTTLTELQQQIQTTYFISGQINADGTGELDSVIIQPGIPIQTIDSGKYEIELQNPAQEPLVTIPFTGSFVDIEGNEVDAFYFSFLLPEQPGTSKIMLKHGHRVLDVIAVSEHLPEVRVLEPNGAEQWDGLQSIRWSASDQDGDPLRFTILYTPDDGRLWMPVAIGIEEETYQIDTSLLPGGTGARILVVANDGFHTTEDASNGTFFVSGKTPQVTLIMPETDTWFSSGQRIQFRGDATDPEDESIPDELFVWAFDSTVFGTGRQVEAILPDGARMVTLRVFDSEGNATDASVMIHIGTTTPNAAPSVTLQADSLQDEGGLVTISGIISDSDWTDPLTASIDWGDGLPEEVIVGTLENDEPDATLNFHISHVYSDNGTFTAHLCGSDDDITTCETIDFPIYNVKPTAEINDTGTVLINGLTTFLAHAGQPLHFTGYSYDPGSDDLFLSWDWGDGLPFPDVTTSYLVNPPNLDAFPSPSIQPREVTDIQAPAFADPCLYEISFLSDDDDGGHGEDKANVIITGNADRTRPPSYWQRRYRGNGNNNFGQATLKCYLMVVDYMSMVFNKERDASSIQKAHDVLFLRQNGGSVIEQFDRELLTLWLNFANGSLEYSAIADIVATAEAVRLDSNPTNAEIREQRNILRRINRH